MKRNDNPLVDPFVAMTAEVQAMAVALNRLGDKMAACDASDTEAAAMLFAYFRERQIVNILKEIYVKAVGTIEIAVDSEAPAVDALCKKLLRKRYGIKF